MTRHPARTPGCARVKRRKQERLISCFGTATHSKMAHPQTWDPERYARNARFVAELGAPVVDLLAPRAGERILDLGCGDGVLTAKLASMGCHVIGVDADRKSTRLNSSHQIISYAVFCLKKKKINNLLAHTDH